MRQLTLQSTILMVLASFCSAAALAEGNPAEKTPRPEGIFSGGVNAGLKQSFLDIEGQRECGSCPPSPLDYDTEGVNIYEVYGFIRFCSGNPGESEPGPHPQVLRFHRLSVLKVHFPNDRGLVGVEYRFIKSEDDDNLAPTDPDGNETNDGSQISIGGEYRVLDRLWVRAGLRLRSIEEDPEGGDAPGLDIDTTEFSLGVEYGIGESASVALIYTNTSIESDGNNHPTD